MKKTIAINFIAHFFILLFLYTAVMKTIDYSTFSDVLHRSPLIGRFSPIVAVVTPLIEYAIAACLLFDRSRKTGLYASFFLMIFFTLYVWYMLNYSSNIPCTCGGILRSMTWHHHLYFNASSSILALIGITLYRHRASQQIHLAK
jgi:hypothetical protein